MAMAATSVNQGGEKLREDAIRLSTPGPRVPTSSSSQMREKGKWVADSGEGIHKKLDSKWTGPEKMVGTESRLGQKLDMPIFCVENPEGWVFRAERFFHLNQLTVEEKLMAAVVCLDGDALMWYIWVESRKAFTSWAELKVQLLQHFRSTAEGSLCQKFLAIRQEGTIAEYRREFEVLSALLTEIFDEVLESTFVKGLKQEIQAELLVVDVHGLRQIMDQAQRIEEKNKMLKINGPRNYKQLVSPIREDFKPSEPFSTRPVLLNEKYSSEHGAVGPWVRRECRLTEAELQEPRKRGLCYHWDEKFVVGHKCKRKFNILVVREEELEMEGAEEDMTETKEYSASIGEKV